MASCGFWECSSSNALSCSHVLRSSKNYRPRESSSFVHSVWSGGTVEYAARVRRGADDTNIASQALISSVRCAC